MLGQGSGGQKQLFYSFNLETHVPVDHLLRGIDRFLDPLPSTATLAALQSIRN